MKYGLEVLVLLNRITAKIFNTREQAAEESASFGRGLLVLVCVFGFTWRLTWFKNKHGVDPPFLLCAVGDKCRTHNSS